jgi:hypothetical protein
LIGGICGEFPAMTEWSRRLVPTRNGGGRRSASSARAAVTAQAVGDAYNFGNSARWHRAKLPKQAREIFLPGIAMSRDSGQVAILA